MMLPPSPFMLGITGTRASRATVRLLRDTGAASIILFARNIRSPAQTRTLILDLQERLGRPLLFAIDHEGGWVLRFASGITAFPGNAALGRTRDPILARKVGRVMGRELRALGIGLNLAPVLDVAGRHYNPGIGIRSFGTDPALVGRLGAAFICGQNDHNVASSAKHFPGKGPATLDAHVALPTIRLPRARHVRVHLPPFRAAIRENVATIMTSHAVYPRLDPSGVMATFSRPIVSGLLRRELGFPGVILSDDLLMGSVASKLAVPAAAVSALRAGHDMLIISSTPELQRESADAVAGAVESGELDAAQWRASRERIGRLLARHAGPPRGALPKPETALPLAIARAAVQVLNRGEVPLPLPLAAGKRVAVFWPDLRQVRDRFTFEGGPDAPLRRLRRVLARQPGRFSCHRTPILDFGDIPATGDAELILFFCFEALRFSGQRKALQKLRGRAERLVVFLLRSPADLRLLNPRVTTLTAFGYRNCQIDAMLEAVL